MSWSPYPSDPHQRHATMARDVLVVVAMIVLGWLGHRVFTVVDHVRVVADAVQTAGTSVQDGFGSAAQAVQGLPVVGDTLSGALTSAGQASAGSVVDLAASGDAAIHRVAVLLGVLTFAIPAFVLLMLYVPMRVAQTRRLRNARLVLRDDADPERRRLLAMRAALALPVDHLVKFTTDPIGDLVRGDSDALIAALMDDAGLVPQQPLTR